jgi:hypothetical protein
MALDPDDLKIISAHLQDAVLRVADLAYVPSEKRFAAIVNRFDWIAADSNGDASTPLRRCRCALRFDRVLRAQVQGLTPGKGNAVAELLAVTYEEKDPPSGFITFVFSGGPAIRLEVECIEAEMKDLGAIWSTACRPEHRDLDLDAVDVSHPKTA